MKYFKAFFLLMAFPTISSAGMHSVLSSFAAHGTTGNFLPSTSTISYGYIEQSCSIDNWEPTETVQKTIVAVPFTIDHFLVYSASAPGTGATVTLTIRKNGVDTPVTATLSGTTAPTEVSDLSDSVSFSQGDFISIKSSPSGNVADLGNLSFAFRMTTQSENKSITFINPGDASGLYASSSTLWWGVQGDPHTQAVSEPYYQNIMPTSGTWAGMEVSVTTSPAGVDLDTATFYENGVPTSMSCTISSSASTCNDFAHPVSVSTGDTVDFLLQMAHSDASAFSASLEWDPNIDGESLGFTDGIGLLRHDGTTPYIALVDGDRTWGGPAENRIQSIVIANTLRKMYTRMQTAISSTPNGTCTDTVNVNASASALNTTVTSGNIFNADTTHTVSLNDFDIIEIHGVNVGSVDPIPIQSAVYYIPPDAPSSANMTLLGNLTIRGSATLQ